MVQAPRAVCQFRDALHLLDIATTGSPDGAGGDPFAQETVVISTGDRRMDTLLRQLLSHSGVLEAIVNTDVIPRAMTHMGLDDEASDRFAMLSASHSLPIRLRVSATNRHHRRPSCA